jgi:flagellar biosynthesis regulator FlaF
MNSSDKWKSLAITQLKGKRLTSRCLNKLLGGENQTENVRKKKSRHGHVLTNALEKCNSAKNKCEVEREAGEGVTFCRKLWRMILGRSQDTRS